MPLNDSARRETRLAPCIPVWILAAMALLIVGCMDGTANRAPVPTHEHSVAQGKVQHVGETDFDEQVLQSSVPVLVDFYAEWCGPCQQLAPTLEELAGETPGVRILKVDVDQNHGLAARYDVRSIPNLMLFKNGEIRAHTVGGVGKEKLKAMLEM